MVVVAHVVPEQPAKMRLVQRDDMVENLPPAASYPALRRAILPGRLDAGSFGLQTRRPQEVDDVLIELRVAIQNDVTIRSRLRKSLSQLLDHPLRGRAGGDVEV
jgi:hypothetical protein